MKIVSEGTHLWIACNISNSYPLFPGIVHSDLKPANFLLVAGKLKLIDFGIANAIQQDKTSVVRENQVGTLNYMSPEAIMDTCGGAQVDANGRVKPRIKVSSFYAFLPRSIYFILISNLKYVYIYIYI